MPEFIDRYNVRYPIENGLAARLTIGRSRDCEISIPPNGQTYEGIGDETHDLHLRTTLVIYSIGKDGHPVILNKEELKGIKSLYSTVSRIHASLDTSNHTIENLSSKPIFVNKAPLRKGDRTRLLNGDEVVLGGLKLNYFSN